MTHEPAAYADFAVDLKVCLVPVEHILDDRQAEPRSACFSAAVRTDAVKTFSQPRDFALGNSDAGITDFQGGAFACFFPAYRHGTTLRGVFQGIDNKVPECALQVGSNAVKMQCRIDFKSQLVFSAADLFGLFAQLRQHGRYVDGNFFGF